MKPERDPETGWMTTGHEWNGITELNTPVPKLVWFFLIVTALFSVGYWLLMPAFPLGSTFTKGLLGADDRAAVTASVKQAAADRAVWTGQIAAKSYAEIERDPAPDGGRARDRPRPVRRQLLGLPWPRRQGQPWLPRPHARVVPVGQHARGDRRDHQGRHQLGPCQQPRVADAGVRPRPCAGAARYGERRRLCAEPVRRARRRSAMSRPARPCSRRTAPSVTAPTARARPTSAHPTSPTAPDLDPWQRRSVDLQRRVGRPAGADAELGRPAVADRSARSSPSTSPTSGSRRP